MSKPPYPWTERTEYTAGRICAVGVVAVIADVWTTVI
jgi:hypothetical protein